MRNAVSRRTSQTAHHLEEAAVMLRDISDESLQTAVRTCPPPRTRCEGVRYAVALMFSAAAWREPERAVQSYAADDDAAGDMAADMIRADGYEPVRMGGLDESIRIEMARPSGRTSIALAVRRQLRHTSP